MVPMTPGRPPAACQMPSSRYVVVVLPLVPVTPTSVSAALGSPASRAATYPSSRLGSGQRTRTTPGASSVPSATTTAAPRASGLLRDVPRAVRGAPGQGEERVTAPDTTRVGAHAAHLDVVAVHRDGAES